MRQLDDTTQWKTDHLTAIATDLRAVATSIDDATTSVTTTAVDLSRVWTGLDGDATYDRLYSEKSVFAKVAIALEGGGIDIQSNEVSRESADIKRASDAQATAVYDAAKSAVKDGLTTVPIVGAVGATAFDVFGTLSKDDLLGNSTLDQAGATPEGTLDQTNSSPPNPQLPAQLNYLRVVVRPGVRQRRTTRGSRTAGGGRAGSGTNR